MSGDEEGKKQADFVVCHREVHAVGQENRSEVYPGGGGRKGHHCNLYVGQWVKPHQEGVKREKEREHAQAEEARASLGNVRKKVKVDRRVKGSQRCRGLGQFILGP